MTASIALDALGDGTADDTATSYLDGGAWTIRLTTSSGAVSEYEVSGVGPGFVEVLGAIAIDATPAGAADEFLSVVGSGASAVRVGVFGADHDGCIARYGDGPDPLELNVGGSIGVFSGLRCGEWNGTHYLESLSATEVDDGLYHLFGTTLHGDDVSSLQAEGGTHAFGVTATEAESIAAIDCPGITL